MNIEQHGRNHHNPVQESMLLFIKEKNLRWIKKKNSFVMCFTARQMTEVIIVSCNVSSQYLTLR